MDKNNMPQIIYRHVSELKKLNNNPRTMNEDDFLVLCESLKKNQDFFHARPLILSDRTGELVIIAGNYRFDAAVHIGMVEVPTYLIPKLTETREREIAIRDNVNNGKWDTDILKDFWSDLPLGDYGLDIILTDNDHIISEPRTVDIRPYKKTHVLISFPPEKMIDVQELLDQLRKIQGIEYEQSSN